MVAIVRLPKEKTNSILTDLYIQHEFWDTAQELVERNPAAASKWMTNFLSEQFGGVTVISTGSGYYAVFDSDTDAVQFKLKNC